MTGSSAGRRANQRSGLAPLATRTAGEKTPAVVAGVEGVPPRDRHRMTSPRRPIWDRHKKSMDSRVIPERQSSRARIRKEPLGTRSVREGPGRDRQENPHRGRRTNASTNERLPSNQHKRLRIAEKGTYPSEYCRDKVRCMTRARKHLVCPDETAYYHVTSRCVRRAFLCGKDALTGRSYEHRRNWIETRLRVLSSLFSIELCAYAVMSNHYHLVVKLNPTKAAGWTDDEVLDRWTSLYRGPLLVQRHRAGEPLTAAECDTLRSTAAVYRSRLGSLSWFMKCLNEPIARRANAEDDCRGHFWEARFHSKPLCSERAVIMAMAYVDLNPVRAGQSKTPERSAFTSINARLMDRSGGSAVARGVSRMIARGELKRFDLPIQPMLGFAGAAEPPKRDLSEAKTLPINQSDYLRLVDSTGRVLLRGKRGHIDSRLAPILVRLGLTPEQWLSSSTAFRECYRNGDVRLKFMA